MKKKEYIKKGADMHLHEWLPVATAQDYSFAIVKCDGCGDCGFKWLTKVFYE